DNQGTLKSLLSDLGAWGPGEFPAISPIEGKIFARLMKRRYGYFPIDTIFKWEGRTKYIEPNDPESLRPNWEPGDLWPDDDDLPSGEPEETSIPEPKFRQ
ncbi:MAG: hypothetical protein LUE27_08995, partial [Clostridia bacterium]|nr:hypothetical protein [Clostridia bacterium]